ncbi:MAG: recombination protein O N-terminal domain-containing protein [Patescibacteria group bacterium]
MREKYHTEALILGSFNHKEANKLFHLFTKEFGFLVASSQAVRMEKSKLRYGLQDFSLCDISIVKTKNDIWKLTNCVPKKNYYFDFRGSPLKIIFIAKINNFLRRFLHGEEKDLALYNDVNNVFENLQNFDDEDTIFLEGIIVLKILHKLGILKDSNNFSDIIKSEDNLKNIALFKNRKREAYIAINQSLQESHL